MHSYSYLDPGIVLRYLCSRSTLENLGLRIRISQDYPEGFWPEILRVLLLGLSWDILVPIPSLENPDLRIRNSQDYPGINYRIFLRFSGEIQGNLGLFSQGIQHLSNSFHCLSHRFLYPFVNFLCFSHCVIWHSICFDTLDIFHCS